jgi:phosphopantothenoylcysteine decarboxylase / phosphopantothenate---cysteine ligase
MQPFVLLGVTGGIAAYKSAELCRLLVKEGYAVQVVMSRAATRFITPLTLETLSGRPVHVRMFGSDRSRVEHVELGAQANVLVVAPATADYLARCAAGRANDLIAAVTLAFKGPVLAAPAMNTNMWESPVTRRNLDALASLLGWHFVQPGSGELACGWTGPGRMAEPPEILAAARQLLRRDLEGLKILVSAGPTVEDIDPVRFISNRSSGRMGYAVAEAASRRGADVTLVSGPVSLPCPQGARLVPVRSALDMEREVGERAAACDAIVMTAAVADFRPAEPSDRKLKKREAEEERVVRLVRNPDILAGLGARFAGKVRPVLVGFALETEDVEAAAVSKLRSKGAHVIVGNLASDAFGGDGNEAIIVDDAGLRERTGPITKRALAGRLLDLVAARLAPST